MTRELRIGALALALLSAVGLSHAAIVSEGDVQFLGDQVTVYRTEYLLQGSRRCAYRISASGR